jgi:glycosyltransferase involved in cell wall biosynthesis
MQEVMGQPRQIFVFTYIPSPYQVELFDALAAAGTKLFVFYARRSHATPIAERWSIPPLAHDHAFANSKGRPSSEILNRLEECDLYVMNYYRHSAAKPLLRARLKTGKPWCFWGERPGVRFRGLLGKLYRMASLWPLFRSRTPIWGIGSWAVNGWRRDFGNRRSYHNVPYFSDLSRFAQAHENTDANSLRILFSGSLIERKGVDLLARAFVELAKEHSRAHLTFAGVGPLRSSLEQTLSPCAEQVEFRGFVPWPQLPAVYAGADVLCVPSRYDGWAMVVPEGLAAGLPVITTDHTGASHDLIRHGINGWTIPANDGGALLSCLREVAKLSPEQLAAMRASAVASVAQHQLRDGVARFLQAAEASISA